MYIKTISHENTKQFVSVSTVTTSNQCICYIRIRSIVVSAHALLFNDLCHPLFTIITFLGVTCSTCRQCRERMGPLHPSTPLHLTCTASSHAAHPDLHQLIIISIRYSRLRQPSTATTFVRPSGLGNGRGSSSLDFDFPRKNKNTQSQTHAHTVHQNKASSRAKVFDFTRIGSHRKHAQFCRYPLAR